VNTRRQKGKEGRLDTSQGKGILFIDIIHNELKLTTKVHDLYFFNCFECLRNC